VAVSKRYYHQWQAVSGPECDGKTKHWTEVTLTVDDLASMIGCAPGSTIISVRVDRDGHITLTIDEHQETPCLTGSSGRQDGQRPGSPPT